MEFGKFISLQELDQRCGIKNFHKFSVNLDMLGRSGYVKTDGKTHVSLAYLSAKDMYLRERNKKIFSLIAAVVGIVSAIIAAVPVILNFF